MEQQLIKPTPIIDRTLEIKEFNIFLQFHSKLILTTINQIK